ncbi:MAG: hypothetical protein JNL84_00585 [Candidatus Accumulibacter sp.]|nr:hypothetical protein [Accumulibacter sp.]
MRRSAMVEMNGGKGPRQIIWESIRSIDDNKDEGFTEAEILEAVPAQLRETITPGMVRDYRYGLVAAGILDIVTPAVSRRQPAVYRLAKDEGIEAPRVRRDGQRVTQGRATEQMWRALRMLSGSVNARELAAHAATANIPVSEVAARDYLHVLCRAGYLRCTHPGKGIGKGGIQARYRLRPDRNTGPRPPMVCRTQAVYDPNVGKVVWTRPVNGEEANDGK